MDIWQYFDQIIHYPLVKFGNTYVTLETLFDFLIVIVLAFFAASLTGWFLKKKVFNFARINTGLRYMLSKIGAYLVFILGFFIGLQALGIDLTSFTVLAGAFGVGIGFGLQNVVNNFVSGIILLSERQLQVGDRVEVGDVNGFIQHVGARSTTLLTTDQLLIIVPNSELISKPVTRWWGRDERYPCRIDIKVGVGYDSDLNEVKELLLKIAAQNPHVLKEPAPFAGIADFADSWITFKLYVSSFDMINKEMALRTELYIALQDEFKKRGISIPFPQFDLALRDSVKVEIQG